MGNYDRGGGRSFGGGDRGGFRPRGRSSFGGDRGGFSRGGGRSFGNDRGGDREMFKAICDNCGKECEVPFRPTSGKPVYCSDCFEKMGGRNSDSRPERSDRPQRPAINLDEVNAKLDRILGLLEPKVKAEVKAPKVKKVKVELPETAPAE